MNITEERAVEILVAHQRMDAGGCLCGWRRLGYSFVEHQVDMLKQGATP